MAGKYEFISTLAKETAKDVTRNPESWARYLNTAARLYRYPFTEQLLIYAQRPDATACASLEIWNERMFCWVNKGAKGIALLDDSDDRKRLKYVFDVSDVHKARRIGRDPNLWVMEDEMAGAVLEKLESIYGETDVTGSFENRIIEISNRIADEQSQELLPDLAYMVEGSFLDGYDDLNLSVRLKNTMAASIAYTVLARCNCDTGNLLDEFHFITEFNSPGVLNILGCAVSELSMPILQEIGKEVTRFRRQKENEKVTENNFLKTLAKDTSADYNALKRKSEHKEQAHSLREIPDTIQNDEGEIVNDEDRVRTEWGLQDSDADGRSAAGGNNHEIRNAQRDLSEGTPQGSVFSVSDGRNSEETSSDNSDTGTGDAGKDNVVTFEQLGVDRLFVDESHFYKNLFLYTKMRNVAGIAQTEAQKSSDMFAKCQYLDELTGGKGVTFATGTPISNSMTELYTNMRYLQYGTLNRLGLSQFDAWASSFGETQTAIELAPEGTGYRAKTRFAKFFNLPELISLFKEAADIQTPDMLKLPVPEAEYENVVLKPSQYQKDMVSSLAERAEAVRDRRVDPSEDNMLRITNDGRKLALDQRLMNPLLPDDENSKATVCVNKAFDIWKETTEQKSTQIIFCDLSTPKGDGTFNVYEDIRDKLIEKGVPEEEIAFIHSANTEVRKAELFAKVRSGQVRFILGSTAKMGAGTNIQDKLIALHHLDVPWRPSDIEQQEGRILRQGNQNKKVKIFRYVTEGTFDSYSWQLIENKQKFIGQIMTSKSPVRSCEDVDEAALSYAEVKALATGNPYIKEKMALDIDVSKLKLMKANHTSQRYRLEDNITKHYPKEIKRLEERIAGLQSDIALYTQNKPAEEDKEAFTMLVQGKSYTERKEAGTALIAACQGIKGMNKEENVGEYLGFKMSAELDLFGNRYLLNLRGQSTHQVEMGVDPSGNITRINNALGGMEKQLTEAESKLVNVKNQLETAKIEVTKPFAKEQELADKLERLTALNALLNMDEKGEAEEEIQSEEPEKEKLENQVEVQNDSTANGNYGSERESLVEPEHRTGSSSISKAAAAAIETMAVADVGLCYAIFQLKDEPELRDYRFMSIRSLLNQGMVNDHFDEITPEHYDQIYNGDLYRIPGQNEHEMLENIFMRFNTEVLPDFKGHSLSVSDVVVLNQHGKLNAYYVDACGFKELPEFARKLEKSEIRFDLPESESRKVRNPMIESAASVRQRLKEKKKIVAAGVISTGRNPLAKDVKGKDGINPVLSSV